MIAATRPLTIRDVVLIAFSTTVISLWLWPDGGLRQIVVLRSPDGSPRKYSLDIEDPRLPRLKQTLETWTSRTPAPSLASIRWIYEVSDFYADQTGAAMTESVREGEFQQVSFNHPTVSASLRREAAALEAQHQYWLAARDNAEKLISQTEAEQHHQRSLAGPPIMLGEQVAGHSSPAAIAWSLLIGVLVTALISIWAFLSPEIRLEPDSDPPMLSLKQPARGQLRLSIPAKWLRVHQPRSVVLRKLICGAIVTTALVSVVVA